MKPHRLSTAVAFVGAMLSSKLGAEDSILAEASLPSSPAATRTADSTTQSSSEARTIDLTPSLDEVLAGRAVLRRDLQSPIAYSDSTRAVQFLLVFRGAQIQIDGKFGPQTQAAVRQYQSGGGLEVTESGHVDSTTLMALLTGLKDRPFVRSLHLEDITLLDITLEPKLNNGSPMIIRQSERGKMRPLPIVTEAQTLLAGLGYNTGVIDGKPGRLFSGALREFTREFQVTPVEKGALDGATARALLSVAGKIPEPSAYAMNLCLIRQNERVEKLAPEERGQLIRNLCQQDPLTVRWYSNFLSGKHSAALSWKQLEMLTECVNVAPEVIPLLVSSAMSRTVEPQTPALLAPAPGAADTLHWLHALSTRPMESSVKIDGREIILDTWRLVAGEGTCYQGSRSTCTLAAGQRLTSQRFPGFFAWEVAREVLEDYSQQDAKVLRNGAAGGRTRLSQIHQDTAIEAGNGDSSYDSLQDDHVKADGQRSPPGLFLKDYARNVLTPRLGRTIPIYDLTGGETSQSLFQRLSVNFVPYTMCSIKWRALPEAEREEFDRKYGFKPEYSSHTILVVGIDPNHVWQDGVKGRVRYLNSNTAPTLGHSWMENPLREVLDGTSGLEAMTLDHFKERLTEFISLPEDMARIIARSVQTRVSY